MDIANLDKRPGEMITPVNRYCDVMDYRPGDPDASLSKECMKGPQNTDEQAKHKHAAQQRHCKQVGQWRYQGNVMKGKRYNG
jgi:hypothetical protein